MEFRQLLDAVPDGIVIVNAQGEIQFANKQIEAILGYSPEEILGKPVELLIPSRFSRHQEQRADYIRNPHARPLQSGLVLFATRKDQTEFQVEISVKSSPDQGGELYRRGNSRRYRAQESGKYPPAK